MDQIASPIENTVRLTPAARISWALLIVLTLYICYFTHLNAIGLAGPDEPRYAWIARDMAESGDWVTPRLYGRPWFEKPVLYYWSAAIFFKLSGPSQTLQPTGQTPSPQSPRISPETAARLPSAVYALLATLAVAWLALRLYGPETARWLLVLLPTTVAMIGFSHAAATDMPFSATLTIAMVAAAVLLGVSQPVGAGLAPPVAAPSPTSPTTTNRSRPTLFSFASSTSLTSFLFGLFLGLAVLAKGPAALILSGGAIFLWALRTQKWRATLKLFHPIAIITFCFTALPWYILCARRNPDFFRVFIIEHNFKRYLTPEFQHIQPSWYYVPVLLLAFFPWTILLLWSAVSGVRNNILKKKPVSQGTFYLLCWSVFCIVFFSTSHSKLPGYILPAIPAVALLVSRHLTKTVFEVSAAKRWLPTGVGASLIATSFAVEKAGGQIRFVTDIYPPPTVSTWAFILFLAGALVAIFGFRRRPRLAFLAVPLTVFLLLNAANGSYWELDEGVSAHAVLKVLQWHRVPMESVVATSYKLPRGLQFGLNFYLRRELNEWTPETGPNSLIFTNYRGSLELERMNVPCPHYIAFQAVMLCGTPSTKPTSQSAQ